MQSDSVSTALLSLSCRILWKLEIRIPFHAENGTPQRPCMDHPTPAYKVIWQRLFKEKNPFNKTLRCGKGNTFGCIPGQHLQKSNDKKLEAYAKTTHSLLLLENYLKPRSIMRPSSTAISLGRPGSNAGSAIGENSVKIARDPSFGRSGYG